MPTRGFLWLRAVAIFTAVATLFAFGGVVAPHAFADDPTVPEPTTPLPDPAPAPTPAPKSKPAPKPVPKPTPPPVVHVTPTVTHTTPAPAPSSLTPAPITPTYTPPAANHEAHHVKSKRHKEKSPAAVAKQQPHLNLKPVGQTLAEQSTRLTPVASVSPPKDAKVTALIATIFAAAIALFAVGAVPPRLVPNAWLAYVVVTRRLEFTLFGFGLLVMALFAVALTH